ncbi:helix-turn-helix domain-containing protein [Rubrivivax sp. RP6-9]|uniref:helix-turn-helix domain-containing protein n=1 Tax=Rubrivivax sp. RP6-9 TaxID=3415750 RepID=UPI003CC5BCF1
MPARPPPALPAYALYGEGAPGLPGAAAAVDALHCESIAARSRLHGWEIRPHRHEHLVQLLWLQRGTAEATLDGRVQALTGPALVTVPALAAHGFRFAPEVQGLVFTVQERHLQGLLATAPGLAAALLALRGWALQRAGGQAQAVAAAARALRDELQADAAHRAAALDAGLLRLLVAAARTLPQAREAAHAVPERALAHVRRFRALVEAQYRQQPALAALAAPLGITPTQLNRVCRQVLGRSALGVLHARLVLEAQRDLAYTAMSVKQIAIDLGFGDAAYFTRFFQRQTGCTPTAWRQRRGG